MKKVDVFGTAGNGTQYLMFSFELGDDGVVKVSGDKQSNIADSLMRMGIRNPGTEEIIMPNEGLRFLKALKYTVTGAYVRAGDVYDFPEGQQSSSHKKK
jgi:hypothetical protein